jgi:hypothetical protein
MNFLDFYLGGIIGIFTVGIILWVFLKIGLNKNDLE